MIRIGLIPVLCVIVVMCGLIAPPVRADDLPHELQPFLPLIEKCRQWEARDRSLAWRVDYEEQFDRDPERWPKVHKWANVEQVNGKAELHIVPAESSTAFVPIGPKVRGEFAIEMVARADAEGPKPLCIMAGDTRGGGPALQFSVRNTNRHLLWTDAARSRSRNAAFAPVDLGDEPKLVPGQACTLRLEVRRTGIVAYVDGKKLGEAPVSEAYNWQAEYQPHAMTVGPRIAVLSWRVESYAPGHDPKQEARDEQVWKRLFQGTTREAVEARLAELVQMLDDDRWVIREEAGALIERAGQLAVPALRQAIQADSAELRMRAERLLQAILPSPKAKPNEDVEGEVEIEFEAAGG